MPRKWKPGEQKRMRRAWSRPYAIRGSAGPVWANGPAMAATPLDLVEERISEFERTSRKGTVPEMTSLREIGRQISDPLFITIIENTIQRCRLYFNSQHNCYLLQHVNWRTREVRISITYASKDRAMQVWVQSRVCWKYKKDLPAN